MDPKWFWCWAPKYMFCSSAIGCGVDTVEWKFDPTGEWKLLGAWECGIEAGMPYMLLKPLFIMGEPTGEKLKLFCIGPAELMMGSLSRLKVSMLKGRCACGM